MIATAAEPAGSNSGVDGSVEGRRLVRVLTVAQRLGQRSAERAIPRRPLEGDIGEVIGDEGIVGGRTGKGLLGQGAPKHESGAPIVAIHFGPEGVVIGDVHHHGHIAMVLGRAPDHGGSADVDILDAVFRRPAARHRGLERVEVHHQEIDRQDIVGQHGGLVARVFADREQPAMNQGVQRLQPAVHQFGEAGQVGDFRDGQARRRERIARSPCRNQRHAPAVQVTRELDQPGLVRDREKRAFDAAQVACHAGQVPESRRSGRD